MVIILASRIKTSAHFATWKNIAYYGRAISQQRFSMDSLSQMDTRSLFQSGTSAACLICPTLNWKTCGDWCR